MTTPNTETSPKEQQKKGCFGRMFHNPKLAWTLLGINLVFNPMTGALVDFVVGTAFKSSGQDLAGGLGEGALWGLLTLAVGCAGLLISSALWFYFFTDLVLALVTQKRTLIASWIGFSWSTASWLWGQYLFLQGG